MYRACIFVNYSFNLLIQDKSRMKNFIYTLFIAVLGLNTCFAQATFSITPNPVSVSSPSSQYDTPAYGIVTNLTNQPKNLKWERILIAVPAGLTTQVCDPNLCWFPTVSSKTFTLAGNATGDMIVHFLNANAQPLEGIVHLKVTNVDNPTEVVTAVYNYSSVLSDLSNLNDAPAMRVYPNPTQQNFVLENAEAVQAVRIFSLDGREVAYLNATSNQTYDIAAYPAGTYVLALLNDAGNILKALELVKN